MHAKMDESKNKMELMATTLQTVIKDTSKKDGEGPHSEGKKDDGKSKEEERGKDTTKANPWLDHIEQLLKESSMVSNYFINTQAHYSKADIYRWKHS